MNERLYDFFFGPSSPPRADYMYAAPHVTTIIITTVLAIVMAIAARRMNAKQQRIVLWVFFGILLAFEIMHRVYRLERGHEWYKFIPMHFSSISVWMAIFASSTRNKHLLNLATLSCMLASLAFLIHPAVGFTVTVLRFDNYYSIITHSLIFVFAVFNIAAGLVSYKIKELWISVLYIALVLGYSALLNFVFLPGSNYLYYVENVTALPYWVFVSGYFLILVVYVTAYYLIYAIRNKRR